MATEDSILSIWPRLRARPVGQCKDISRDAHPGSQAEGVAGLEAIKLKHIADMLKCNEEIGDPGNFAENAEQAAHPIRVAQSLIESRASTPASVADKQGGAA